MADHHPLDAIVCGTCVADILVRPVPLTEPPGAGRLFHVDPIEVTTGGIVANTGIGMARLGLRVAAATLVGDDLWGRLIRERLAAAGLDTTAVETVSGQATSTTAVLVDPGGERSFAHHGGAPTTLDAGFFRRHARLFGSARVALVGYVGLMPALERDLADALRVVKDAGCLVALETAGDGGTLATVSSALPLVDCYVPSLDEARHQTGRDDPREIVARYRDHGAAGIVGVKLGRHGTLLSPRPDAWLEIPCLPAPGAVIDTTGAGDALLAGLLAGRVRGLGPREAGLLGAAAAACCVTALGATAGLRDYRATAALAGLSTPAG
ncbi:MAG: carbohydrate kinase family protein [Planctomycetaceae bacterium]